MVIQPYVSRVNDPNAVCSVKQYCTSNASICVHVPNRFYLLTCYTHADTALFIATTPTDPPLYQCASNATCKGSDGKCSHGGQCEDSMRCVNPHHQPHFPDECPDTTTDNTGCINCGNTITIGAYLLEEGERVGYTCRHCNAVIINNEVVDIRLVERHPRFTFVQLLAANGRPNF